MDKRITMLDRSSRKWDLKQTPIVGPALTSLANNEDAIIDFHGKYFWLDNFYHSPFSIGPHVFKTVEHYFQAMKATCEDDFRPILNASSPGIAKGLGNCIRLRNDWEDVKYSIMYVGVWTKFEAYVGLAERLVHTGEVILVEGNVWNDQCWGICNGKGDNWLGKILMKIRDYHQGHLR